MWFLVSTAILAVGGFVAWAVAAWAQPVAVVGGATGLFAAVLFLTYLTGMGLPVAVARFGHGPEEQTEGLWRWTLGYAAVASAVGSLAFVLVAPAVLGSSTTGPLTDRGPLMATLLLTLLVGGTSWATLAEIRLMTLRAWPWMVLRTLVTVVVRIPLVLSPLAATPLGLLLVMAGPTAASGAVTVALLAWRRGGRRRWTWVRPEGLAVAWRFASVNWVGSLAAQAPQFVTPLIVAAAVPAAENAGFYLAWSISTVVFLIPHTIGQVVVSESSRHPSDLRRQARTGLVLGVALTGFAALVAWVGAPAVTAIFGPDYGTTAEVLPVLCLAALPWTVTSIGLAVMRTLADAFGTTAITVGFALLTLIPMVILVDTRGVDGAPIAWLAGNLAASALAMAVVGIRQRQRQRRRQVDTFTPAPRTSPTTGPSAASSVVA